MSLNVKIAGIDFRSPLFVAAGPPGRDANALIACAEGGAGGLVAKTISVVGAEVPRPCMARPSGGQLPNSMLNVELWSDYPPEYWIGGEYQKTLDGLAKASNAAEGPCPLIASMGYNAADMHKLVPQVEPFVVAFEFSCHYTKLEEVRELASAIRAHTKKPIFAKLSPHGHDLLELARVLLECGVTGFVLMNSLGPCLTLDIETERPLLGGPGGKGWLSGPAIRPIAVYWVSQLAQAFPGVPIIGVGGVTTWKDAVEFFMAGASAVQICTAAIYKGPKVFKEINDGIVAYLKRRGISNVSELRGRALVNLPKEANLVPGVSQADERCIHCGQCAQVCPYEAITVDTKAKQWKIEASKCYGCGLCTTICPKTCLNLVPRK